MATTTNPFDLNTPSGTVPTSTSSVSGIQPAQFTAITSTVDKPTETVAGQLEGIMAQDNPLMQRARAQAKQDMAARGLVNSSIAQGAGVAAMLDKATPIATSDASTYANRATSNMNAQNTVGIANAQNVNAFGLQTNQQQFTAGENKLDRAQTESLAKAQQTFQAGENVLDRAQQIMIADKNISANAALQKAQQEFTSGENILDRTQQTTIANAQITANKDLETARQTFTSAQNQLDRAQQTAIADKTVAANAALQTAQQTFTSAQNQLDRAQQAANNAAQITANKELETSRQTANAALETSRQAAQTALTTLQAGFDKAKIPAAFGADLSRTTMASVDNILADATLTPDAKKTAIANVIEYANKQVDWANAFYGATIPQIPGVNNSTVTGGGGNDTVAGGGGNDMMAGTKKLTTKFPGGGGITQDGTVVDVNGNPIQL
jgi:hypothetical protein